MSNGWRMGWLSEDYPSLASLFSRLKVLLFDNFDVSVKCSMKVGFFMFNDRVHGGCSLWTSLLNERCVQGWYSLWTSLSADHIHGNHHFLFVSLGVYYPFHLFMWVFMVFHWKEIIFAEGWLLRLVGTVETRG